MTDKKLDIQEFRESGLLREVNRRFFHPLGLALSVREAEDGTWVLDSILDSRDDPEGFYFAWDSWPYPEEHRNIAREQASALDLEMEKRRAAREALFGNIIQPI